MSSESSPDNALSVGEFTRLIRGVLEMQFSDVWIAGEVSEVSRPMSGHIYFTIKDEEAQLRCVMWRTAAARLKFKIEEGTQLLCLGSIDIYPPRGSYQLVVQQAVPQGVGAMQLAFAQLHKKLAAEGLFDADRKREIPSFPRRVAFVTSPSGAAVRDFLEVARRRWPGLSVLIIPARVQGEGAAAEIARGIEIANRLADAPDVLLVGRGGGSVEDLWCFNEEPVVRAIYASRIPVVSAVGHEIDVTLADLVADLRALTPSEAAERIVPSRSELLERLSSVRSRLASGLAASAKQARRRLEGLAQRRVLSHPRDRLQAIADRLDQLHTRGKQAMSRKLERLEQWQARLAGTLHSLSPLAVLGRGYSVTQREADGRVVEQPADAPAGTILRTRVAGGEIRSIAQPADAP